MRTFIILGLLLTIIACDSKKETIVTFGKEFEATNIISKEDLLKTYETLKPGDSIDLVFKADVKAVCKKKGCWMTLGLNDKKKTFVKFRDYAFFVPLDADSLGVATIKGKAFVHEYSVADLKEHSKDAGKSQADIDAITKPKKNFSFLADGVQLYRK